LQLKQCLDENPGIRGIMLGSHGLFTWGDTAYESYINTLEVIEKCAEYLEENYAKKGPVLAVKNSKPLDEADRKKQAAAIGSCSAWFLFSKGT
jgi:rhamnose utilization protein RhaD (predicted bifunctional aldolase and dehydrogenase)